MRAPRHRFLLALAVTAAALAGCATTAKAPRPDVPTMFAVDIGYENLDAAYQAEAFFPRSLTVNAGDSVVFTMRSHGAHTVTFGAPAPAPNPFLAQADGSVAANPVVFLPSPPSGEVDLDAPADRAVSFDGSGIVSSGYLGKPGDMVTVTFTAPGTWTAACLFHPAMTATFIVNPMGTPRPMTDADYRLAAAAQIKDAQAAATHLLAGVQSPDATTRPDGTRSYVVVAGVGSAAEGIDFMRFLGGEHLTVKPGDSVTFDVSKNSAGVMHTVTFLANTEAPRVFVSPASSGGPPRILVNPRVLAPAPLTAVPFDSTTYTSSGLLLAGGPTPQAYTLTFTRAGTFPYRCLFHDAEGMTGTIVVQP